MFKLFEKIKHCHHNLVAWSRRTFGNTKSRIEEKQNELKELINLGYATNLEQIHKVRDDVNDLMHQEEVFWRQRSKAIWLPARDKNTKFFHKRASQRRRKNYIDKIMDKGGMWRIEATNIAAVVERYFTTLFSTSHPNTIYEVVELVDAVVTEEMDQNLLQPFVGEEVRKVLYQMLPSKSPSPDGMSPFFFQKFWHIVVTEAVLSILYSGHFLSKMNFTHILLIPKKKEPQSMSDYRPISLSNVISRLVSKVLPNRVKTILPYTISNA